MLSFYSFSFFFSPQCLFFLLTVPNTNSVLVHVHVHVHVVGRADDGCMYCRRRVHLTKNIPTSPRDVPPGWAWKSSHNYVVVYKKACLHCFTVYLEVKLLSIVLAQIDRTYLISYLIFSEMLEHFYLKKQITNVFYLYFEVNNKKKFFDFFSH